MRCPPVNNISYIIADVTINHQDGVIPNTFNSKNLQSLSVLMSQRAKLNQTYLPLAAFSTVASSANISGEAIFAIPKVLTMDKLKLKEMLDHASLSVLEYKFSNLYADVIVKEVVNELPDIYSRPSDPSYPSPTPSPPGPSPPGSSPPGSSPSPDTPDKIIKEPAAKKGLSVGAIFGIIFSVLLVIALSI